MIPSQSSGISDKIMATWKERLTKGHCQEIVSLTAKEVLGLDEVDILKKLTASSCSMQRMRRMRRQQASGCTGLKTSITLSPERKYLS